MESIFTIPFTEYVSMEEISHFFRKGKGYSILIPSSRQQKGFDFVLFNQNNNKSLKFQVKSSKVYMGKEPKREIKKRRFQYYFWMNKFEIEEHDSDYYLFIGIYNKNINKLKMDHSKDYKKWYKFQFFIFSKQELITLFNTFTESTFAIGFDNEKQAFLTKGRGAETFEEFSQYILDSDKMKNIEEKLEMDSK